MTLADMCHKIVARLNAMPCQCEIDDGEMKQCCRCQAIGDAEELSETILWGELE